MKILDTFNVANRGTAIIVILEDVIPEPGTSVVIHAGETYRVLGVERNARQLRVGDPAALFLGPVDMAEGDEVVLR